MSLLSQRMAVITTCVLKEVILKHKKVCLIEKFKDVHGFLNLLSRIL